MYFLSFNIKPQNYTFFTDMASSSLAVGKRMFRCFCKCSSTSMSYTNTAQFKRLGKLLSRTVHVLLQCQCYTALQQLSTRSKFNPSFQ